jgi:hypothetical protein
MTKSKQSFISLKEFEENLSTGDAVKSSNGEIIILSDLAPVNEETREIRKASFYNMTHNKKHEGYLFHDQARNHVVMYIKNYPSTYIADIIVKK